MLKSIVIPALLLFVFSAAHSQKKSLGVGTSTPNPNAALHVESPTGNQGFLMPKLTTAQRTDPTFLSQLSTVDAGLLVYDADELGVFIWNGTAWEPTAELKLPFATVNTTAPNKSNLLDITYSGTDTVGVALFRSTNANNSFSNVFMQSVGGRNIFGSTTSSVSPSAEFRIANTGNNQAAILGVTNGSGRAVQGINNGTGAAGNFTINNATNTTQAVFIQTNGLGSGANIILNNALNTFPAVQAQTTGTGRGGYFIINNPANTNYAVAGETNGASLSAGVYGNNTGNGFGVFGKSNGTSFGSAAVYGEQTGTGDAAGAFRINNAASTFSGLYGETNGSGPAVYGKNIGVGNSGFFENSNATNASSAIFATTTGVGRVGSFSLNNPSSNAIAFQTVTNGLGMAGNFIISNASNTMGALNATTNGLGSAGNFTTTNAANTSPALNVETNGGGFGVKSLSTGTEVAGYFQTSNTSSNASTLFSLTNAPGGVGVGSINTGNGLALGIFQGGMKVSTHTLSAGTTITTRAVAYQITGGGPYTFNLTPALTDGEMFFFYNTTGSPVSVGGSPISPGTGLLFIVLGGIARPF